MIVCHCAVVGDKQIAASVEAGATCLSQVCASTGAGRDCGSCVFSVRRIICETVEAEAISDPVHTLAEAQREAS